MWTRYSEILLLFDLGQDKVGGWMDRWTGGQIGHGYKDIHFVMLPIGYLRSTSVSFKVPSETKSRAYARHVTQLLPSPRKSYHAKEM